MKDFIQAAAPFVLCGIAVAIICARPGGKKGQESRGMDNRIAIGMALGLMLAPTLKQTGAEPYWFRFPSA